MFDALTSARAYKDGWPIEQALHFLAASSGTHFDPICVSAFMARVDEVRAIHAAFPGAEESEARSHDLQYVPA